VAVVSVNIVFMNRAVTNVTVTRNRTNIKIPQRINDKMAIAMQDERNIKIPKMQQSSGCNRDTICLDARHLTFCVLYKVKYA